MRRCVYSWTLRNGITRLNKRWTFDYDASIAKSALIHPTTCFGRFWKYPKKKVRCKCHCLWQLAISCYSTAEVSILLYRRALRLWKNFAQSDKPQSEASTFKAKSLTTDCKREQICVQCSTDLVREMRSSKPVYNITILCLCTSNQPT